MFVHLATEVVQAASSAIPTTAEAQTGFPIWVLATWGACVTFALWVIYVVIREWNEEPSEESSPDAMLPGPDHASAAEQQRIAS